MNKEKMSRGAGSAFGGKKGVFLCGLALIIGLPFFARADAAQVKIISAPQTIASGTVSTVFTLESQDSLGAQTNVTTTTRVSLVTDSLTGQFVSSPAAGPCGNSVIITATIANGTSHKSFCYTDSAAGSYTITISVPDQPAVLGDSQLIVFGSTPAPTPPPPPPVPPSVPATSTPLTQSPNVKIYRFLPNPAGTDTDNEWIEIKSTESQDVLLDGWFLDDTGSAPAADALVLSGLIIPGEVRRFMLTGGTFALNNSGGDEVNLYFADSSLADKAQYSVTAYDDGIFEFRDGIWQPPALPQTSSGGSGGGGSTSSYSPPTSSYSGPVLKLNEIFSNALGDDAGKEWIEIYNPGNATATLDGYFLADGDSENWSASAWAIPTSTLAGPLGVIALILPKDAFALNNSGTEKVKLFSPQKQLLDFVTYEDAPENQSWSKNTKGKWEWAVPTFNLANDKIPPLMLVIISEILPKPDGDAEEFIELFNPSSEPINLEGAVLQIGTRKKVFEAGTKIEPNGFLTIYEDNLPTRLSNTGQKVSLYDAFGRLVSQAIYPKAETGMAYASQDGKEYVWTASVTAESTNEYILGESTEEENQKPAATSTKTTSPAITKAQANSMLKSTEDLKQQVAVLQESINVLQAKLNNPPQPSPAETEITSEETQTPAKPPMGRLLVWPAAFAALGGAVYVTFKKLKK